MSRTTEYLYSTATRYCRLLYLYHPLAREARKRSLASGLAAVQYFDSSLAASCQREKENNKQQHQHTYIQLNWYSDIFKKHYHHQHCYILIVCCQLHMHCPYLAECYIASVERLSVCVCVCVCLQSSFVAKTEFGGIKVKLIEQPQPTQLRTHKQRRH